MVGEAKDIERFLASSLAARGVPRRRRVRRAKLSTDMAIDHRLR